MASLLFVRTGNGGANAAVQIPDLGYTVPTGAGWTALCNSEVDTLIIAGTGQFTPTELSESVDLLDLITVGTLEYSTNGTTQNTKTFDPHQVLVDAFANNDLNISTGRLTLPNGINPPSYVDPRAGDLFYDTDDGYLVYYNGATWITITDQGSVVEDHGILAGLNDDDHVQYSLLSGNYARNTFTGEVNLSGAGGFRLPTNTDPAATYAGLVGEVAVDSNDGYMTFHDGSAWVKLVDSNNISSVEINSQIDHGLLAGLADDDHTQYIIKNGSSARNTITGKLAFGTNSGELQLPVSNDPLSVFTSAVAGDIAYDSNDGYVVYFNGSSWVALVDANDATDHGALTGLADDDHSQYMLLSGNATRNAVTGKLDFVTGSGQLGLPKANDPAGTFTSAVAGDIAYDSNDGYVVFYDGFEWITLVDTTTNITDHGALSGLGDDDHSQYGLLAGNAARNAVTGSYDFTNGGLIIPTTAGNPIGTDGAIAYDNADMVVVFDAGRAAALSIDRQILWFGRDSKSASNIFLRTVTGISSNVNSYRMPRSGRITAIVASTDVASTWDAVVYKNGFTNGTLLGITASTGSQDVTLNSPFVAGDRISIFASGTGIDRPIVGVEVVWAGS